MESNNPLDQFTVLSMIGKGSYANVMLVRKKNNGQLYALKSMKKKYIEKKNQIERMMNERKILSQIQHPFLIKIHSSFQNTKKLFLVLQYCPGGQLFGLLYKRKRLSQADARFYSAQVMLAIEYLHSKNIIYRDLKPENILITANGYIKLTDFGLSISNIMGDYERFSVCGTPEYLAPEVIKAEGHGRAVDWWCLGCLIFELVNGLPPFYSKNKGQLYEKIKSSEPEFNKNWSKNLRDLLSKLLNKNPQERLKFASTIKEHPWFVQMKFNELLQKTLKSPFVPILQKDNDVSNFSKEFTNCAVSINSDNSLGEHALYEGFSFECESLSSPKEMHAKMTEKEQDAECTQQQQK